MRIYSIIMLLLVVMIIGCDDNIVSPKETRMTVNEVSATAKAYFQIFPLMYSSEIWEEKDKELIRNGDVFEYLKVVENYYYSSRLLHMTDDKVISWLSYRKTNYYGDVDFRYYPASKDVMYFIDSLEKGYNIYAVIQVMR